MAQPSTVGNKISFQTVDIEVSVAQIEYEYLKFICGETLRTSDDVMREQIRKLHIAGQPSFDEWRHLSKAAARKPTSSTGTESQAQASVSTTNGVAIADQCAHAATPNGSAANVDTNGAVPAVEPTPATIANASKRKGRTASKAKPAGAEATTTKPGRKPRSARAKEQREAAEATIASLNAEETRTPEAIAAPEASPAALENAPQTPEIAVPTKPRRGKTPGSASGRKSRSRSTRKSTTTAKSTSGRKPRSKAKKSEEPSS